MEAYRLFVAAPILVAFAWVGAVLVNPRSSTDIFPAFWWAMTAALTALFLALIRWGFGKEEEDGASDAPGPVSGARQEAGRADRAEDPA